MYNKIANPNELAIYLIRDSISYFLMASSIVWLMGFTPEPK